MQLYLFFESVRIPLYGSFKTKFFYNSVDEKKKEKKRRVLGAVETKFPASNRDKNPAKDVGIIDSSGETGQVF